MINKKVHYILLYHVVKAMQEIFETMPDSGEDLDESSGKVR